MDIIIVFRYDEYSRSKTKLPLCISWTSKRTHSTPPSRKQNRTSYGEETKMKESKRRMRKKKKIDRSEGSFPQILIFSLSQSKKKKKSNKNLSVYLKWADLFRFRFIRICEDWIRKPSFSMSHPNWSPLLTFKVTKKKKKKELNIQIEDSFVSFSFGSFFPFIVLFLPRRGM